MINIDINKQLHGSDGFMNLNINIDIKYGEFLVLTGKSGSGKTTFLRILAGLKKSNSTIKIGHELWQDDKYIMPVQKRNIGFVFQDYALFSNMSVLDNLLFVKKDKKLANRLLDLTELSSLKNRLPNNLSGGQKQRVSLCRAFMNKPKLLLMDEPLSALDPSIRKKLQQEILKLHKEFNTTTIMVSHDTSEIYQLATRVIVLDLGKIIQDGNAKEILLKNSENQKFSFEGELLNILKVDESYIATIAIFQQLVEIVISPDEAKNLEIGQKVRVSTKTFHPSISKV